MALFDLLSFAPKGSIGDLTIPAMIEEIHIDTMRVTEHPVEMGAAITDHAYVRPREVVIKCGWSNSTLDAFVAAIPSQKSRRMTASDYVSSVYDRLLAMQETRKLLTVTTSKRQYEDMLIVAMQVTTDASTSAALLVQATLRQVIIVKTRATTLPSKDDQARPATTASVEITGVKQVIKTTPMQGGAVANEDM